MKKLITPALIALMSFGFASCKKEAKKQEVVKVAVTADTIKRPISELAVSCQGPSNVVNQYVPRQPTDFDVWGEQSHRNGTVIASFPLNSQGPKLLPRQSWSVMSWYPGPSPSYTLTNQADGNLVLTLGNAPGGALIWSSGTGNGAQFYLQNDWNFVGYAGGFGNSPVWDTGTYQFKCDNWTHNPTIYLFLCSNGELQIIGRVGNGSVTRQAILAATPTTNGAATSSHGMVRYQQGQNQWTIY